MAASPYRLLPHTADIRVRIDGRSLRHLFQNAVFTVSDLLFEAKRVRRRLRRRIDVQGDDTALLLVRLLQEVVYLFDAKGFAARRLEILDWKENRLKGLLWGEPFQRGRHGFKTEIKAVTYHGLKIGKRRGRWFAEIVLDV